MLAAVCVALILSDPDRPLVPVATLGQAKMVCRDHGRILATPDGKRAVTARGEWFDLEAGRPINSPFPIPDDSVVHSVLDDCTVVVESAKHLHFFPPGTTKPKRTLETLGRRVWLTSDGQVAFSLQGWTDDTVSLLVADKAGEWKTIADHLPPVVRLAVNTAGTHVALLFTGYGDVAIFDLNTKRRTDFLEKRPKPRPPTGEFEFACSFGTDRRTDVALSPDGKVVYIALWLGYVMAFNSDTGELLEEKSIERGWWNGMQAAHAGIWRQFENNYVAWIGDGLKQVRVTDGGVLRVFNSVMGKQIDTHSTYPGLYGVKALNDRWAICWTEDGRLVTWDMATGKPTGEVQLDSLPGNTLHFAEVTVSGDAKTLIARNNEKAVHADLRTGKVLWDGQESQPVFGPNGKVLLVSKGFGPLTRFEGDPTPILNRACANTRESRLHFDPTGRLAVMLEGSLLEGVELATGKSRWRMELPREPITRLHGGGIRATGEFGRRFILVREGDVCVCDLPTQKLMRHFEFDSSGFRLATISADGRWLAVATAPDFGKLSAFTLFLLDHPNPLAAAVELPIRSSTYTTGVAFTPDGKTLLTSHAGGTAHAWNISRFTSPETNPREGVLWDGLGSEDEKVVGEVMAEMAQTPQTTVRLMAKRLTPIPPLDEKAVKARIAELGNADFRTREAATTALAAMDERAVPLLKAAVEATPLPEVADRLNTILAMIDAREPPPEWARQLRAVELLETVGGRDAERVLTNLAGGAPGARLTSEAERTLRRMRAKR